MNSRKRAAPEHTSPLPSPKHPRTRLVVCDEQLPGPPEQSSILKRWKNLAKEFGILFGQTVAHTLWYTTPEHPPHNTCADASGSNELTGRSAQNIHRFGDQRARHHPLSTHPPLSTPRHGPSVVSDTSATCSPRRPNSSRLLRMSRQYGKTSRRDHIYKKAHQEKVRLETERAREEMQKQLYVVQRSRGYSSNFQDFQSLLAYQAQIERLAEQDDRILPSPMENFHVGRPSPGNQFFDEDSLSFARLAFDKAKATLNEPKPPRFQPTLDQLKLSQRRKDQDVDQYLLRMKIVPPTKLPLEEDAQVDVLLRKRGIIARFAREQVNDQDLSRLKPGQWLNDEIINFYGAMILARPENCKENPPRNGRQWLKIHYFSTFFWPKLKDGYEKGRLAKWTKKVDIFAKDVILIPINRHNAHWTSAAINFRHKRIESYDSMGTKHMDVFKLLRSYLDAEHRNKKKTPFDFTGWQDRSLQAPLQENGYDCGVFTCQFLQGLSRGEEAARFAQKDMPYLRRRMIWEIGNARLRDEP